MAYLYLRKGTLYLGGRRNGARVWKSCRTASKRVAQDYLRRFERGEAIPELGIEAELRGQVRSQVQLGNEVGRQLGNEVAGLGNEEGSGDGLLLTVGDLVDRWLVWCESYYRDDDGVATGELAACRAAVVPLKEVFGDSPAAGFGPVALKRVRERMIGGGWVRSTVNKQCGRVKRCFGWGVENELVPASVLEGLRAVRGLRRGRSDARDSEEVKPVPDEDLKAVLAVCPRILGAMIMVGLLTAARPGEVVILRPCDFDCSGRVWIAVPSRFKSKYRGLRREIYFGPRAQEVVRPFLDRPVDAFLFSPREAEEERIGALVCGEDQSGAFQDGVTKRVRRGGIGNEKRRERDRLNYARRRGGDIKSRRPGDRYSVASYRRALARLCLDHGVAVWNPNQLRHNAGTEIRKLFGLEAAQVVLGHARADVTQVYAEVDRVKAMAAVAEVG